MNSIRSSKQRVLNRFFGVPSVAQAWARIKARSAGASADLRDTIPFHPLDKPLADCTFSLITTGGIHLSDQEPFDMENPDGDASFRAIRSTVDPSVITITHKYYDHGDADSDLNVIFPLAHFRDLVERSVIGGLAPRHYGFMGHIDGPLVQELTHSTAPEIANRLLDDGVDCAFLTPA